MSDIKYDEEGLMSALEAHPPTCLNGSCRRCKDCLDVCADCGFENSCTKCLAHELWLQKNMEEERKRRHGRISGLIHNKRSLLNQTPESAKVVLSDKTR